jgi:hypothetical protein
MGSGDAAIVWWPWRSPEECCAELPDLDKSVTVPVGAAARLRIYVVTDARVWNRDRL